MRIELQGFDGCPGLAPTRGLLAEVLSALEVSDSVDEVLLESDADVRAHGFLGSPSVLVDGEDIEGRLAPGKTLCSRVYESEPVPPRWMIEAVVLRALVPRGVLFLCVANSARSQLAEGIARRLAGPQTTVFSAGSAPSHVQPLAIQVLDEIGIDIGRHHSKDVTEIPAESVDTVVTLCAEEVCPLWLGTARRVHWGLPDPVGDAADAVQGFRTVRDELVKRLEFLFGNRLKRTV